MNEDQNSQNPQTQSVSEPIVENSTESSDKNSCTKCVEYKDGWQRAVADYQNLLRATASERSSLIRREMAAAAERFLPVYSHLKQAVSHLPKNASDLAAVKSFSDGIEMILRQFTEALKASGVVEMKTVGEQFDPEFHEAVGEEVSADYSEGVITREIESGYLILEPEAVKPRVLRPAKVIIAKAK